MTESLAKPRDTATAWLHGLAARGVTASIRKNRLCLHPASAYKTLTDSEVLTMRHARDAIKAAIVAGVSVDVVPAPTRTPPAAPRVEPCPHCHCAPCIGSEHHAFALLHYHDPAEVDRRRKDATAEMYATLGRSSGGLL